MDRRFFLLLTPLTQLTDENNYPAYGFQHIHDVRLVRAPEIQGIATLDRNCCQLAHRVCRVLFSGTGKSYRLLSVLDCAIENHSGGHYISDLLDFFRNLPSRIVSMELRRGIRVYRRSSVLHVL